MPAPVHARLRVSGHLYDDAAWSIGCAFLSQAGNDPFAQDPTLVVQDFLEDWCDEISKLNSSFVWPESMRTLLSSYGAIEKIRASRVGQDGRETAVAELTLGVVKGGVGQPSKPAQSALVATLSTGRPGASYRGRLYLPAIGGTLTEGALASPAIGTLATDVGKWLADVGDVGESLLTFGVRPAVVSTTKGVGTLVTAVRVGNRLDTQRRRSEAQQETYAQAALPN